MLKYERASKDRKKDMYNEPSQARWKNSLVYKGLMIYFSVQETVAENADETDYITGLQDRDIFYSLLFKMPDLYKTARKTHLFNYPGI